VDASPYFAPSFFAASFFSPLLEAAPISPPAAAVASAYFAPSYFAPSFFAGPAPLAAAPTSAVASAYFAPSYFAPSFFAGPAAPTSPVGTSPSTGSPAGPLMPSDPTIPVNPSPTVPVAGRLSPYFAPSYFAPSYFAAPASPPVAVTPPVFQDTTGRVHEAFGALVGLLQGTGAFEVVIFGDPSRRGQAGAGQHPLAFVMPRGWEDADDYDPTSTVRRLFFAIRIVVRADDGADPYDQLHRLTSTVEGVVNRADLGGSCLPALTWIRAGRHDQAAHYPELAIELEGDFSMLVGLEVAPSAPA